MSVKSDAVVILIGAALVAAGIWYIRKQISDAGAALVAAVTETAEDGAEAVGVLGTFAWDTVRDPLDAFGLSPGLYGDGTPKWQRTTPFADVVTPPYQFDGFRVVNDPVSNSESGVNFNYF